MRNKLQNNLLWVIFIKLSFKDKVLDAESDLNDSLTTGLSERGDDSDNDDLQTCSENELNEK